MRKSNIEISLYTEMEEFWRLVALSLSMFIGCYAAGSIPLLLALSEGVLRKVTTFGAGLLIGTALIVIIPEGIEALFGEILRTHHSYPSVMRETVAMAPAEAFHEAFNEPPLPDGLEAGADGLAMVAGGQRRLAEVAAVAMDDAANDVFLMESNDAYSIEQLQFMMGLSLVLGFIFMLVIDQCGGGGHAHTHSSSDAEGNGGAAGGRGRRNRMTATIGLVVHAAADGLALGAAAGLGKADVELIIFLAIMLHKAPAAFGFTSFLIHEGYDKSTAKKHLLAFSLAAPLAAFISYFGLVRVMYIVQLPLIGIAMLFSAGTFLYVSTVHVLNEITNSPSSESTKLNSFELFLVVLGAFLPLLFNVIHSH